MEITLLDYYDQPVKQPENEKIIELSPHWEYFSPWVMKLSTNLSFAIVWTSQMMGMLWIENEALLIEEKNHELYLEKFFEIAKFWEMMDAFMATSNIVFYLERNKLQLELKHYKSLLDTDYCRAEGIDTSTFHWIFYWWKVYHHMIYLTDRKEISTHFSELDIYESIKYILKNAIHYWNHETIYRVIPRILEEIQLHKKKWFETFHALWKITRLIDYSERAKFLNSISIDSIKNLSESIALMKSSLALEKRIKSNYSIKELVISSLQWHIENIIKKNLWYRSLYATFFQENKQTTSRNLSLYSWTIREGWERIIRSLEKNNDLDALWTKKIDSDEQIYNLDKTTTMLLENFCTKVKTLRKRIDTEFLEKLREESKWLYSIWWKLHFVNKIDIEKLEQFKKKYSLLSTYFKMIHADWSMLLPPVYSSIEMEFILRLLIEEGVTEWKTELQLWIPWRLPNELAWILWSAILLLTDRNILYWENAFSTTHDADTWAKIMAYDSWVLELWFNDNPITNIGRTDMLWRASLKDIYNYQIIWSLLSQSIYWWKYELLWKQFIVEYRALFKKYWFSDYLYREWIYDKSNDTLESSTQHYALVNTFTTKRTSDRTAYKQERSWKMLLSYELKDLLKKYKKLIKSTRL